MNVRTSACVARPATPDDFLEVAAILYRIFGVRQDAAALRWKSAGPAGRLVGSAVLTSGGRIVGFLGQIPVRIWCRGRELLAVQGADVGILEEHRRLDAFLGMVGVSLRELRAAGVALTYGIANADAAAVTRLLGQRLVAPVPLVVRPIARGSLPGRGWGARVAAGFLAAWADRCDGRAEGRSCAGWRVGSVSRFDERFDRFWGRIRDDYPILVVRDAAYLNWRYVDGPGASYERLCIENVASGELEGFAVLGLGRRRGRVRGRIAELATSCRQRRQAAAMLLRAAVARLRTLGADVAEGWAFPHTHLRAAYLCRGFVPRRTGEGGFQVGAPAAGASDVGGADCAENWFLSMGDSDTV